MPNVPNGDPRPMLGSLATLGYANRYAQSDLDDVMIANAKGMIVDIRCLPFCEWSHKWNRAALRNRSGKRYIYAGQALGTVNERCPDLVQEVRNEGAGIPWLIGGLEKGLTLILLCECADYGRCHRKVIYEKVKAQLGDRLPEYALGQRVMTPNGPGIIDASIPLHVQRMRGRYSVMLDALSPTRRYLPHEIEPYNPSQPILLATASYVQETARR